jgi:hypothetical protein
MGAFSSGGLAVAAGCAKVWLCGWPIKANRAQASRLRLVRFFGNLVVALLAVRPARYFYAAPCWGWHRGQGSTA